MHESGKPVFRSCVGAETRDRRQGCDWRGARAARPAVSDRESCDRVGRRCPRIPDCRSRPAITCSAASLPISDTPQVDWRVFLFAIFVTLATSIAFGVGPAFRSSRNPDANSLRARSGRSGRMDRLRGVLVIGEIGATVVLLIAAGLLVKALWNVQAIDAGFRTKVS